MLDYIELLHDSGKYKSHVCEILPFTRSIDVYETPVSAGTGNMFLDGSKATVNINSSVARTFLVLKIKESSVVTVCNRNFTAERLRGYHSRIPYVMVR